MKKRNNEIYREKKEQKDRKIKLDEYDKHAKEVAEKAAHARRVEDEINTQKELEIL